MEEQVKTLESPKEFSFSERFRELRIRRLWSQSYVAARIDVANSTISRWESGKALPAVRFWQLICELFGVDIEALGLVKEEDEEDNVIHGQKGLPNTRLKHQRKQRGWSQQQLADAIGTTPINVSRWENGITSPIPYFKRQLCESLGVDAEALGLVQEVDEEDNVIHGQRGLPNTRLKRQRELLGWSQVQVADAIDTYPVNISRWERGETRPDADFQQKLCELFKKKAEELGFSSEE